MNNSPISFFCLALLLLICVPKALIAQTKTDSLAVRTDSTMLEKKGWDPLRITGIRIGGDLAQPILAYANFDSIGYEFTADIMVNNKFFIVGDFGFYGYDRGRSDIPSRIFINKAYGNYYRFGLDYNLLHKSTLDDALFFGLRYGWTNFTHNILFQEDDPYWFNRAFDSPTRTSELEEENIFADWYELVAGFKVEVYKNFYLATQGKIRFRNKIEGNELLEVNMIPGYGLKQGGTTLGWNVQILYRIPLMKHKLDIAEREEF